MMLEKDLQKNIINKLNGLKIPYYKTTGGLVYGKKFPNGYYPMKLQSGFPDLLIFANGELIMWELKSDVGKVRDTQKEVFRKLNANGYSVRVVRPDDWEKTKKEINKVVIPSDRLTAVLSSCGVEWYESK